MRSVTLNRDTLETRITLTLDIDGRGVTKIDSGCGFLDHMLTLFGKHGRFDLTVTCKGDTQVDYHHTVEDIGILLGEAFAEALGEKKGIIRYGSCILPMDEALLLTAVDFCGRATLCYEASVPTEKVGDLDTELVKEFWLGFTRKAECALHIRMLAGENSHHIIEGMFKSAARSMKEAVKIDLEYANEIPSTKGVL